MSKWVLQWFSYLGVVLLIGGWNLNEGFPFPQELRSCA